MVLSESSFSYLKKICGPALLVFVATGFLYFLLSSFMPRYIGINDLIQYWATSQLFITKLNPYDAANVAELQRQIVNLRAQDPILMWNPPNVFPLILLFTFWPFFKLVVPWMLFSILLVLLSIFILSKAFESAGGMKLSTWVLIILAINPMLITLIFYGQIAVWNIFSLSLFLYLTYGRRVPFESSFPAGMALSITLIKPHLLYLLYLIILIESVKKSSYQTILGMGLGFILMSMPALIWFPQVFSHYFNAILYTPPFNFLTPSLGAYFQVAFDEAPKWYVRFLPSIVFAIIIFILSLKLEKKSLGEKLPCYLLAIVASIVASPYGWVYDQLLLLPVIIFTINWAASRRFILGCFFFINLVGLFLIGYAQSNFYLYYSMSVLILFAYSLRKPARSLVQL